MADACGECDGLFLEHGELTQLAPSGTSVEAFAEWLPRDPEMLTGKDVKCPACASYMRVTTVQELELEIDICSGCKGIWLDSAKLETLENAAGKLRLRADTGVAAPGEREEEHESAGWGAVKALTRFGGLLAHMVAP